MQNKHGPTRCRCRSRKAYEFKVYKLSRTMATDELVRVSSSRGTGLTDQKVLDPKVLLKPDLFNGSRGTYPTWSFVFTSWCGALSQDLLAAMKEAKSLKAERTLAVWSPVQQRLSVKRYHKLMTFCRDKALEKLQNIGGLESSRQVGHLTW